MKQHSPLFYHSPNQETEAEQIIIDLNLRMEYPIPKTFLDLNDPTMTQMQICAQRIINNRVSRTKNAKKEDCPLARKEEFCYLEVIQKLLEIEDSLKENRSSLKTNQLILLEAQKIYCICCIFLAFIDENTNNPNNSLYLPRKPTALEVACLSTCFINSDFQKNPIYRSLLAHLKKSSNNLFTTGTTEQLYKALSYKIEGSLYPLTQYLIDRFSENCGKPFTKKELIKNLPFEIKGGAFNAIIQFLIVSGIIIPRLPRKDAETNSMTNTWSLKNSNQKKGSINHPQLLILTHAALKPKSAWLSYLSQESCLKLNGVSFHHQSIDNGYKILEEIGLIRDTYDIDHDPSYSGSPKRRCLLTEKNRDTVISWAKKGPDDYLTESEFRLINILIKRNLIAVI